MTNQQIIVVWIVAILISALLFYIGIVKPHVAAKDDPIGDLTSKLFNERSKGTTKNYWLGALAPILILGACAFLTTLRKKPS